jgi:hypothetical protein
VTFWVFDVSSIVAMARERARDRLVSNAVIARQCARFEWLGPEEAHALKAIEA